MLRVYVCVCVMCVCCVYVCSVCVCVATHRTQALGRGWFAVCPPPPHPPRRQRRSCDDVNNVDDC